MKLTTKSIFLKRFGVFGAFGCSADPLEHVLHCVLHTDFPHVAPLVNEEILGIVSILLKCFKPQLNVSLAPSYLVCFDFSLFTRSSVSMISVCKILKEPFLLF